MTSASHIPHPSAPSRWDGVDEGLHKLECLANETASAEAFYQPVCQQLLQWELAGVAIWTSTASQRLKLAHRLAEEVDSAARFWEQSPEAIATGLKAEGRTSDEPFYIPIRGSNQPTICIPWQQDDAVRGVLQLLIPSACEPATKQVFLKLGQAVAELLALFHAHHDRRVWQQKCADLVRWQNLLRGLHSSFELSQVAHFIAHDGRAILQCDRVTVLLRQGTRYRVAAVSGADFVHRRSQAVAAMQRLCALVAKTKEPLWSGTEKQDFSPQMTDELDRFREASPARTMGVIPLSSSERTQTADQDPTEEGMSPDKTLVFAALLCEQFTEEEPADFSRQALQLAACVRAPLWQAWQLQGVPGLQFWLAWQRGAARYRWLSRGALILAAVMIVIGLLLFVPAEVKLRAPGELQPAVRHDIFAPCDSLVTEVLVEHGAEVAVDAPLLQLRSVELDLETQRVAGELETLHKQLSAVKAERLQTRSSDTESRLRQRRLTAEEEQFAQQIRGLESRQKLLAEQQADLKVCSPAAGNVITWDVRERLVARPLRRGDLLLTVANEAGPWQVELKLPARQASRLWSARKQEAAGEAQQPLPVSLALSTTPGTVLTGQVEQVAQRIEVDEQGESYVLIIASVPRDELPQRTPGAIVYGRIHVGESSLAVAWFHEVIDAAKLWLTW